MSRKLTNKMLRDLRHKLNEQNISVTDFCKVTGIHRQTVYKWFSDTGAPCSLRSGTYDKLVAFLSDGGEEYQADETSPGFYGSPAAVTLLEFLDKLPPDQQKAAVNQFIADNYNRINQ